MIADAITTTDLAIYLAIYASLVSTAAGTWALFSGVFRDRARITVRAAEAYLVNTTNGPMVIEGEDTLKTMGVQPHQRSPVLKIVVRNRGRRHAKIETVSKTRQGSGAFVFGDLAGQVPFDLPAESSKTLLLGATGGYEHGSISPKRFYAVDGADRVHPLRQRNRRRAAHVAYGWALKRYYARQRRMLREAEKRALDS